MSEFDSPIGQIVQQQHFLLEQLLQGFTFTIGENLPITRGMLQNHLEQYQRDVARLSDNLKHRTLEGRGIRATALRQIKAMFPDKNIENFISGLIPRVYPITYSESREFECYLDHCLDRAWHTQGFRELEWLHLFNKEDLGEWFRGEIDFYQPDPEVVQTGFYRSKSDRHRNMSERWVVAIKLEGVVTLFTSDSRHNFLIYVPVEEEWVTTQDYKYVHVGDLKTEFDSLLKQAGLFEERPVLLDNLIDEIVGKFTEKKFPPMTDYEQKNKFAESSPTGYGRQQSYVQAKDKFKIHWFVSENTYDVRPTEEEPDRPVGKDYHKTTEIIFLCLNEKITIARYQHNEKISHSFSTESGSLESNLQGLAKSNGFNDYPVLLRKVIRDCFVEAFDTLWKDYEAAMRTQYYVPPIESPPFLDPQA